MNIKFLICCFSFLMPTLSTSAEIIDSIPGLLTIINPNSAHFIKNLPPINNDFKGKPGCYIACYSHHKAQSVYAVSPTIFVMGQVRVPGTYVKRICQPTLFKGKDISASSTFSEICKKKIKACKKINCWAGGDTGSQFGRQ